MPQTQTTAPAPPLAPPPSPTSSPPALLPPRLARLRDLHDRLMDRHGQLFGRSVVLFRESGRLSGRGEHAAAVIVLAESKGKLEAAGKFFDRACRVRRVIERTMRRRRERRNDGAGRDGRSAAIEAKNGGTMT